MNVVTSANPSLRDAPFLCSLKFDLIFHSDFLMGAFRNYVP